MIVGRVGQIFLDRVDADAFHAATSLTCHCGICPGTVRVNDVSGMEVSTGSGGQAGVHEHSG